MSAYFTIIPIPLFSTVKVHDILCTFNQFLLMQSVSWLQRSVCMNETHRTYATSPLKKKNHNRLLFKFLKLVHVVHTYPTTELLKQNFWGPYDQSLKRSASSPLLHRLSRKWLIVGKLLPTTATSLFSSS